MNKHELNMIPGTEVIDTFSNKPKQAKNRADSRPKVVVKREKTPPKNRRK